MQFYKLKEQSASHSDLEEEEYNSSVMQEQSLVTETPMDEDEEDEYVQQNDSPSRGKGKAAKRAHSTGLPKRRQVKNACITCRKDHGRCDDQRPCNRCVKLGIADGCADAPRKRTRSKTVQIDLDKEDEDEEEDEVMPLEGQTTRFILRRRKSSIHDSAHEDTEEENEESIPSSPTDNFSTVVTTRKIRRRIQQQVRYPNSTLVSSIETVTSTSTEPLSHATKCMLDPSTPTSPSDAIKYCKPKFKFVMKTIVFCDHPPADFQQNPNL